MLQDDLFEKEGFEAMEEEPELICDSGFTTERAYWKLDRAALLKVLTIASLFPSNTAIYVGMVLRNGEEGSFIDLTVTNRDYYFQRHLNLLNSEQVFAAEKTIYVKAHVLEGLVRCYSDFLLTFDPNGDVYFENSYISSKLEAFLSDDPSFTPPTIPAEFYHSFLVDSTVLDSIQRLFSFAIRSVDSRVNLTGHSIKGFFMLYEFDFESDSPFAESTTLRKLDVPVLSSVLSAAEGCSCYYATVADRFYLLWKGGILSFLNLKTASEGGNINLSKEPIATFEVNLSVLKKALSVSSAMSSQVAIFQNKAGRVIMETNRNTKFDLGEWDSIDPSTFSEVSVSTDLLKRVVGAIPSLTTVLINLLEDGVSLSSVYTGSNGVQFTLTYTLGRVSLKGYERSEKVLEKKSERENYQNTAKSRGELHPNISLSQTTSLADVLNKR